MKDIIHALQNVSYQLLLVLNLHRCVWHQEWVGDRHVYALDLGVVVAIALITTTTNIES